MKDIAHLEEKLTSLDADDQAKIPLLQQLAIDTLPIDYAKSLQYAKKSLSIAKDISQTSPTTNVLIAKSLEIIGDVYNYQRLTEKAINSYQQAIKKYHTFEAKKDMAITQYKLGKVFHIISNYNEALACFRDSLTAGECINDKIIQASILYNIGSVYTDLGIYPKALEFNKKALELRQELGDQNGIAASYNNIGLVYHSIDNYSSALSNYRKSLKIKKELKNRRGIANTCNNIGNTYQNLGEYDKSIEYYLKSIKLKEELGIKRSTFSSLNNIGISYQRLANFEKAKKYYQKSLKLATEIDHKKAIANALNNIGTIYMDQDDSEKALEYFYDSLKIKEEIDDTKGMALSMRNIGNAYKTLKEYNKALEYSLKAFKLRKEIDDRSGIISSARGIGEIYTSLKRYDDAIIFLKESLESAKQIKAKGLIKDCYLSLSDHYVARSDFQNAYISYKQYSDVKNDIFNEEKNIRIEEMQARYEIEKRDREAEISHLKNVKLTAVVSELNQKNKLISQQKLQLSKTLKELKINRERLEIANSILRHDITNDLTVIRSAIRIYHRKKNSTILDEIDRRVAKSLDTITRQWKQEQYFRDHCDLREVKIEEVINEVIKKNCTCKIVVDGKANAYADNSIYSVFDNLITNSINHGKASKITIQISSSNDFCLLKFIDNGCGIPQEVKPHIYDEGFIHGDTGHTGIGLYIVKQTIKRYGGDIQVEDNNPHGAIFNIKLKRAL